jgi:hypothetical protein
LAPGTYKVTFGTPSGGYVPTTANAAADDIDSDAGVGGMTGDYVLVGGQVDTSVDAGFYQLAAIGNYVWKDVNANGLQDDSADSTMAGVTVTLLNGAGNPVTVNGLGNPISPVVTGSNGLYSFTNLLPGMYKVQFSNGPTNYFRTTANVGADDNIDSDADAGTGVTDQTFTLVSGDNNTTVDAGYYFCPPSLTFTPQVICGSATVNLNSFVPVDYTGGTWTLNGNIVTNPASVTEGTYVYTKNFNLLCTVSGTMVVIRDAPDYTPTITFVPNTITGVSQVGIVIKVSELLNKPSCAIIRVSIPVLGSRYSFIDNLPNSSTNPFNPTITAVGGMPVNNSDWQYLGIVSSTHRWQYIGNGGIFPANGISYFGFNTIYDNQGTSGVTSISVSIAAGSGGERIFTNNNAGAQLTYSN